MHLNLSTSSSKLYNFTPVMRKCVVALSKQRNVKGHINSLQSKFVDYISSDKRVRFIDKATLAELRAVVQTLQFIFEFKKFMQSKNG